MSKVWTAIIGAVLLSACSNQQTRSGETFDRIGQELKAAAGSKPRAAADDAVGRAMMPPLQVEEPAVAAKPEPRFDLAVNNAPASQVFLALVSGTRYSMLFPPELSGNVTLNLKGVTVREALEAIRDLYGYEYRIQGKRITIQPNSLQTRIFQINYLAGSRRGTSDLTIASTATSMQAGAVTASGASVQPAGAAAAGATAPGLSSPASQVRTTSEVDFWKNLETALQTIVGHEEGNSVIINPVSGVVMVKALPAGLRTVENYLKATQLIAERQVMLEAKIIDVTLSDSYQSGINWAAFDKAGRLRWSNNANTDNFSVGGAPVVGASSSGTDSASTAVATLTGSSGILSALPFATGGAALAFRTGSFAALLSFLETQGAVSVLSSPRIATLNNQKAVLKVGTDEVHITGFTVSSSTVTTTVGTNAVAVPTPTTSVLFSGISLDVMPQIDDAGNIVLHIHPAVSRVRDTQKQFDLGNNGGVITLPLATREVKETDSIVRVPDGSIVAIGGLMDHQQDRGDNGVPGLHRVPAFGALFGQKSATNSKRELVILIKATVIQKDGGNWQQDLADTQDRLQALDPRQVQWQPQ